VSTAPKELREVDIDAKMSKSKRKKLKKRAKRNQALLEETMQHLVHKKHQELKDGAKRCDESPAASAEEPPGKSATNEESEGGDDKHQVPVNGDDAQAHGGSSDQLSNQDRPDGEDKTTSEDEKEDAKADGKERKSRHLKMIIK
jgi:hypothetical protein